MGLRCLFGHEFGGREVERDRREDGDEVVVAYRTVETCERCGSRRVVSENKEIKPLDSSRDHSDSDSDSGSATEPTPPEEPTPASEAAATPTTEPAATDEPVEVPATADAAEPTDDDAEVLSGSGDDTAPAPEETATPAPNADDAVADASDDAAIILDDAADVASAASAGSEQSAPDPAPTEPTDETGDAWPEQTGEDRGVDAATPASGGASVSTDDHGRSHDPWPGAGTDESDGVERDRNGTRFVRAESRDQREGPAEFRCPNCESARPASSSSLRPGDVCPDCRKGYLAEVTAED